MAGQTPTVAHQGAPSADRVNPAPADREPLLHKSVICLAAPSMSISGRDGQLRARSAKGQARADGVFYRDQRVLSHAVVTVDEAEPEPLGHRMIGADKAQFTAIVRSDADTTPDSVLMVVRTRSAEGAETLRLTNNGAEPRELTVTLTVAADLAQTADVRAARRVAPLEPSWSPLAVAWAPEAGPRISLLLEPTKSASDPFIDCGTDAATITWNAVIAPREPWQAGWSLSVEGEAWVDHPVAPLRRDGWWEQPGPISDPKLDQFVRQSLDDLSALLLADPHDNGDVFAAAGAPWYLTLFGRDSLWTARMLLPLGPGLAAGTLRALGRRQGQTKQHDANNEQAETEEEYGKILHELRRGPTHHQFDMGLPARYYGSVDATPLFVLLYVEAVEAGLDEDVALRLLPRVHNALDWLLAQGAKSATDESGKYGWLRYKSANSKALVNHGWKDSTDALVPDVAERLEVPAPITLAEVQAYTYEAISRFTALKAKRPEINYELENANLLRYAKFLKQNFHATFHHGGCYVMAIDGKRKPVTGLTSNMGHLLGTGILDEHQSAQVAEHLQSDELDSGWGLRTRAQSHKHFNPLGYHSGAVWAHDTAIAIRGLVTVAERAAVKHPAEAVACAKAARKLAAGLIDAAAGFDYRIPELYSGTRREPGDLVPTPFPTSCRPQAWAAASAVATWHALGRLDKLGLSE